MWPIHFLFRFVIDLKKLIFPFRFSSQIPRFANLAKIVSQSAEFKEWVCSGTPERNVPQLWAQTEGAETTNISNAMNKLLAIQAL